MPEIDIKTWCELIKDYCITARHNEAVSLFLQKIRSCVGFKPNYQVFAAILKSCAALSAIKFGNSIHGCVVKQGHLSCHSVYKALLNMYAKCGGLDDCQKLFGQMGNCDAVMWNIVLSGFSGFQVYDDEVMQLFYKMHIGREPKPNSISIAIILPACARSRELDAAKSVHSYAIKSGFGTHTLVGNALVSMYSKCGLFDESYAAFNNISYKDVISWNAMIAGFAENKLMEDAFNLFSKMLKEPTKPNYATIANILPVCAHLDKHLAQLFGKEIHCYVLRRSDLAAQNFVCNALMSFYSRIGQMGEAEALFRMMKARDLISWNAVIAGNASNGEWCKALELFHELLSLGTVGPDPVTLVSILPVCAQLRNLQVGKKIHGYILRHPGLFRDTTVGNALVSFYAKCNDVEAALRSFLMISRRDVVSWNTMLDAYAENCYNTRFLDLLHLMHREGVRPDSITFLIMAHFCASVLRVNYVKEIHSYSIKAGFLLGYTEPTLGNAILDAYAKCGNVEYAFKIFQSMSGNLITCNSMISGYVNKGSHNDVHAIFSGMSETDLTTWNLIVQVYAESSCPAQALSLFQELQDEGLKPDALTIMSLLPVCAQMASVHLLRQCHGYVVRACLDDIYLKGALLDVYAKCGGIGCASKLFQSSLDKDLVMYTAMVGGYAMHGMGEEALKVFSKMVDLGIKPDRVIFTAILSACSHAGLVDEGLKIFYSIAEVHGMQPTMEQYACVVDLLARGGRISDAFSFVTGMPVEANANIWGTLLGACRTHHEVELGRFVADHLFQMEANDIGNYVVMSNLYAADARWDGVMEMRKMMRMKDLKKPAGCSWIEVEGRKNIFVAGDSSHLQRDLIYSTLSTLDQQLKEP